MMILPLNSNVDSKPKPTKSSPKFPSVSLMGLPIFLLVILGIGMLPGYLKGGKWDWFTEKTPSNLAQILSIEKRGFPIPEWEIIEESRIDIGGKQWLRQIMRKEEQEIELLIAPQPYYKEKPAVEWSDLATANVRLISCRQEIANLGQESPQNLGIQSDVSKISELLAQKNVSENILQKVITNLPQSCQNLVRIQTTKQGQKVLIALEDYRDWETKSTRKLSFPTNSGHSVNALFQKGWSPSQTFAVVNWYAWESGGNFAAPQWFWQDLKAQLNQGRTGWLAVSLRIPISPNSEIEAVETEAKIIAQTIQDQLIQRITTKQ